MSSAAPWPQRWAETSLNLTSPLNWLDCRGVKQANSRAVSLRDDTGRGTAWDAPHLELLSCHVNTDPGWRGEQIPGTWHIRVQTKPGKLFLLHLGSAFTLISLWDSLRTCCCWSWQPSPPHLASSLARLQQLQTARDSHSAQTYQTAKLWNFSLKQGFTDWEKQTNEQKTTPNQANTPHPRNNSKSHQPSNQNKSAKSLCTWSGCRILQGVYFFLKANAPYLPDGQNLCLYPSKEQHKPWQQLPRFFFLISRQPPISLVGLKSEMKKILQQHNCCAAGWTMFKKKTKGKKKERKEKRKKRKNPTLTVSSVHRGALHRIVTIS